MPRSPEPQLVLRAPRMDLGGDVSSSSDSSDSESSTDDAAEEEYVVEEIRASRWDDTARDWRYLVKWKGYGEGDKTWEPRENLQNCLDLVAAFEAAKAAREAKRQSGHGSSTPQASSSNVKKAAPKASTSTAKKVSGKKATSSEPVKDDSLSLKKHEERRIEAKKKAAKKSTSTSAGQAENDVADKWEKKAEKKAEKKTDKGVKSTSKLSPAPGNKSLKDAVASKPVTGKRPRESVEPSTSVKKTKKAPRISTGTDDEVDDDELPAKSAAPRPASAPHAPPVPVEKAKAVQSGDSNTSVGTNGPERSPSTSATSASAPSKAAPSKPTPASPPAYKLALTNAGSKAKEAPRAYSPVEATPGPPPPSATLNGALKQISFKKQRAPSPGVRFDTQDAIPGMGTTRNGPPPDAAAAPPPRPPSPQSKPPAASPAATTASAPPPPPAPPAPPVDSAPSAVSVSTLSAEEQVTKARRVREQLVGHKDRLRRTIWCQQTEVFSEELALPLACVKALHIPPHMIMRMKNRGVAVLFDMQNSETTKGEGHAMGYCLLSIGAETPNEMSKVQAVCIHRSYGLENIEGLYCELTNLASHTVEFLHFGQGKPMEPIFSAGYHVVVTRAALQQSASLERFCLGVRQEYGDTCEIVVHPATLAAVRNRLPNWNGVLALIHNTELDVVDRSKLPITDPFVTYDKHVYFSTAAIYPALPPVDDLTEREEITSYLRYLRATEPEKHRRFVVIDSEVLEDNKKAWSESGIELHSWGTLTETIAANNFG